MTTSSILKFLAGAGLACGLLSMATCSAPESPEPATAPTVSRAEEPAPTTFREFLYFLADGAGMQETPHVVVNVVHDDALPATEAALNTLVVGSNGTFNVQFTASTEAEGREMLGFFARAALYGLHDAEQNTSLNVRHQAPQPATL